MTSTWFSPDEVLEDLAATTGSKFGTLEGHYVFGDAPPPTQHEESDEDMQGFGNGSFNEFGAPDLHGITRMLRMVQDSCDTSEAAPIDTGPIVISKPSSLNPNVKEFVPKGFNISKSNEVKTDLASSSINDVNKNDIYSKNVNNSNVVSENVSENKYDIVDINEKAIVNKSEISATINSAKENEVSRNIPSTRESEIMKLKSEISDGAKSDCFEVKKQKNVAISTLLRLYASNNNHVAKKPPTQVKLITPDYFEQIEKSDSSTGDTTPITEAAISVKSDIVSVSTTDSFTTPQPSSSSSTFTGKTYTISSCSSLQSSPSHKPSLLLDPEVRQSIEKVNKWFEEPVKRKSPGVFLGPIGFKKKEPVKSPLASTVDSEENCAISDPQQYQPSNYAADLVKAYTKRKKDLHKSGNTWKDLDIILKERDEEIIRKRTQQT